MDTKPNLFLKEEVYRIVGAPLEVLNTLGHGLNEDAKVIEAITDLIS